MPKLSEFRKYHYDATVKVSENTRTLALSAIGLVWLFKTVEKGQYQIPLELMYPLVLVFSALALDFAQYVYRSIIWHIKFRKEEKNLQDKAITEDTELYAHAYINAVSYLFFYLKIVLIIIAYIFILSYFLQKVQLV